MENNEKKSGRSLSGEREEKITGGVKPLSETVLSCAAVCLALIAVFETAFLACFKETGLYALKHFGKAEVAARICAVFLATAVLACGAVYEKKVRKRYMLRTFVRYSGRPRRRFGFSRYARNRRLGYGLRHRVRRITSLRPFRRGYGTMSRIAFENRAHPCAETRLKPRFRAFNFSAAL